MSLANFKWYGPTPTNTQAYNKDSAGNDYYGEAPMGTDSVRPRWTIWRTLYQGTAGAWIVQFARDPATSLGSDAPIFSWSQATTGLTYATLGTTTGQ